MYQLKISDIPLKPVWVVEPKERMLARSKGIPFIVKPTGWSDEDVVKGVLYNVLVSKFPYINWADKFGFRPTTLKVEKVASELRFNPGYDTNDGGIDAESADTMQVSDSYRETGGGFADDDEWTKVSTGEFFGDFGAYVDIDVLQQLKLLPKFMDDIATAIRTNLEGIAWLDGYNKKLGIPTGFYSTSSDAPNLIILDVSGSVPRGLSYTMLSLIDTLRTQCNADLIITSGRSKYWKCSEELPTPKELQKLVGGCNECEQFYEILRTKVLGKHWGNVIVFGDNDSPLELRYWYRGYSFDQQRWVNAEEQRDKAAIKDNELQSTRIDNVLAFHTYSKTMPGYGLWTVQACPNVPVKYDTSWRKCL